MSGDSHGRENVRGECIAAESRVCACGATLVACVKCGEDRCLNCDPYSGDDDCGTAWMTDADIIDEAAKNGEYDAPAAYPRSPLAISPSGATATCPVCGTMYDRHELAGYVPPYGDGCDNCAEDVPDVAALFVEKDGPYYGLPGVDPWDIERDARLYDGPWPVVAHPPCARWSRLAGFTEARFGYKRGADGGCFEAALASVRRWGGVLEHPAYSAAWDRYGLPEPLWHGGWTLGLDGGASCYVEQGRYGLPVKKGTWLYAYGVELPELRWGYTPDGDGVEPNNEWGGLENWRDRWVKPTSIEDANSWWKQNRHNGLRSMTPPPFRDVLLEMARSAHREKCAA